MGGPIKITCGIVLVTRTAQDEIRTVYRGHIETQRVIVRHLACNYNELDDLKPGARCHRLGKQVSEAQEAHSG